MGLLVDGDRPRTADFLLTKTRAARGIDIALFAVLLVAAGALVVGVRARVGWDQDIWWHLRTGAWIAERHELPATDPFSQYGHDKEWVAYSWLFALVAHTAHRALGLKGLVLLCGGLGVSIAAALYVLLRGLGASPFAAAPLTAFAFYAMMGLTTPRPWLFTMLFFLIELHVILTASARDRSRVPRVLWLLPPLFFVWANIHIQFVVGLVALAAAALDAFWYEYVEPHGGEGPAVSFRSWVIVTVLCVLATMIGPYNVRLYAVARDLTAQTALWSRIGELVAPTFRVSGDWVVLALVLAASVCVGWQARSRPVRVVLLLLFVLGIYLGFRSRRDTWVTATLAACLVAAAQSSIVRHPVEWPRFPGWLGASLAAPIAALVIAIGAVSMSEQDLVAHVRRGYPAAAAEFVEQHGGGGPLYNYYDWGGYLIWRLPQLPVSMDGRSVVHGERRILRHVDTWQGRTGWDTDPELTAARIVVGPKDAPLASLLRLDRRFALVYEDRDGPAVVFEKR
jgi:hypothetical protein